jgi:hypothetical protein
MYQGIYLSAALYNTLVNSMMPHFATIHEIVSINMKSTMLEMLC